MGTKYEMPHMASCENYHALQPSHCAPTMATSDRWRPALNERAAPNEQIFHPTSQYPAALQNQTQAIPAANPRPPAGDLPAAPLRQSAAQQTAPAFTPSSASTPVDKEQSGDAKMTLHNLNIPERISPNGGSLADLLAEVTALLWFQTIRVVEKAGKMHTLPPNTPVQPLASSAVASQHFKKWALNMLTTTQVTQNVAVLALLYIYRLKMANPTVKGRPGSEFRLLTVALMLGNKFLDDNTYTNKTWADVSYIPVTEIHVMEVEFLSNMRYSLLVTEAEWDQWLDKLKGFWRYLELAQRAVSSSPSPLLIPSPTARTFTSPLPSPTGSLNNRPSPNLAPLPNGNGAQNWPASYGGNNAVSPLALKPEPQMLFRKRSSPDQADSAEPPAKRVNRVPVEQAKPSVHVPPQALRQHPSAISHAQSVPQQLAIFPSVPQRSAPVPPPDQARLPVPSLTLNTVQTAATAAATVPVTQSQPYGSSAYAPPQASPLSLPPLVPGVRAMSTVFPASTYTPPQSTPVTCGTVTPTTSFPPVGYGTPTKRLSPQNAFSSGVSYAGSSPLVDPFGHHMATPMGNTGSASGLHTPISHSPSVYLQQRNSPYRPVRHVSTLLYPPPSAFLEQYHLPNPVLPNQMHYQPLGKRNEYRTGILPEFALTAADRARPAPGGHHPAIAPGPYQSRQPYPLRPTGPPALSFSGHY
ncbi:Meiotically up-regulated gene 80 protein [Madurella mycetomatis]|uniref:Meiotically up-regulated gene 80 protein n=1 Tax=Madurella mycetomatis TaxID=100816 RepID=A0A175WE31_9PEZI|nr:Meiotically up-regulated gene 80 protein [Madurella mycetomatis]KXX82485.1 Meiotically up-regulated gene 80 protein [Madurella mycetomatis]